MNMLSRAACLNMLKMFPNAGHLWLSILVLNFLVVIENCGVDY